MGRFPERRHGEAVVLAGIVVAVVTLGWVVARDLRQAAVDASALYTRLASGLDLLDGLQFQTQEVRRILLYALHTPDANRQLEYVEQSRAGDAGVLALLADPAVLGSSAETAPRVKAVRQAWDDYVAVRDEVIGLILESSLPEAVALDESQGTARFNDLRRAIASLKSTVALDASTEISAATARADRATSRLLLIVLSALAASALGIHLVNRRAALEGLLRSEAHKGSILQAVPDPVISTDAHGLIIELNAAAERTFGVARAAALGRRLDRALLAPAASDQFVTFLIEAASPPVAPRFESLGRRHDGSEFPLEIAGVSHLVGRDRVWTFHMSDISRHRAAEEHLRRAKEAAEAADRAKSDFLATVSHELRTPLTGVIGLVDLLESGPLSPAQREHLRMLRTSAIGLSRIVNDVLDSSRIEAGLLSLAPAPFALRRCLEDAMHAVAEPAARKSLRLGCTVDAGVPDTIVTDEGRVRQVLLNLLSNAVKFTDAGFVEVHVSSEAIRPGEVRVAVAVRDSGAGIPPELQGRLFQRFSQVDPVAVRRRGGAGLGLAISHGLSRLLGGSLTVESLPGAGTTFTFTFAAQIRSSAAPAAAPPAAPADAAPPAVHARVLLVEDNDANRRVLRLMLEELGAEVEEAVTGSDAVVRARSQAFDAIFMDVELPDVDGLEATRLIRANQPDRTPPINALTANATAGEDARCRAAGMSGYISKPVRLETLAAALASLSPHAS